MSNKSGSERAGETEPIHDPVADENASHHSSAANEEGEEHADLGKYDQGGDHPIIGLIVFVAIGCVALILMVVATPLEFYTLNDTWRDQLFPGLQGSSKTLCVTAWGMKAGCRSASYYERSYVTGFCQRVRLNFKIVEAFSIMTISFMVLGLIAGVCSIYQKVGKAAVGSIGAFAMVLAIIPWGVVAGMYYQKPCCNTTGWLTDTPVTSCVGDNPYYNGDIPPFKEMGKYAPAFGLAVAAFALQLIAIIFAFVPL